VFPPALGEEEDLLEGLKDIRFGCRVKDPN